MVQSYNWKVPRQHLIANRTSIGIEVNSLAIFFLSLILAITPASVFAAAKDFHHKYSLHGVTFDVSAINSGSLNKLIITTEGLKDSVPPIKLEIDGSVSGAEVADIDNNQSPEIYIYVTSSGSGSFGSLVAYSANNRKSITPISMPDIAEDKKLNNGYMGHDEFAIIENSLSRRFPVYKPDDTNSKPTGGMRQVTYKLSPGEAGWVLHVKRVDTY